MKTIPLKEQTIGNVTLSLNASTRSESDPVTFTVFEIHPEAVAQYRDYQSLDLALEGYKNVQTRLNCKVLALASRVEHCTLEGMTPYETAEFLLRKGYSRA